MSACSCDALQVSPLKLMQSSTAVQFGLEALTRFGDYRKASKVFVDSIASDLSQSTGLQLGLQVFNWSANHSHGD